MLDAYAYRPDPYPITPGELERGWMDEFPDRHAYRCLPLNIANTFGWDARLPVDVTVSWNGGPGKRDVAVETEGRDRVESNFSRGIVTFLLGYVFRTPPGWQLLVMAPPNAPLWPLEPLAGIVETSWLPYPFTMNYRFAQPGNVHLKAGTPICRVVPIQMGPVLDAEPRIFDLDQDRELEQQHEVFRIARDTFREAWLNGTYQGREQWQRKYFKGEGAPAGEHRTKVRMAKPRDLRPAAHGNSYGILVVDDFAPDDMCDALKASFAASRKVTEGPYAGRVVAKGSLLPDMQSRVAELLEQDGVDWVREHFGEGALGVRDPHICVWRAGSEMPPHADDQHPDPTERHATPDRDYAVILYLNDDFEGGELWFPDLGVEIKPKKGTLVAFPGGASHFHGIAPIRGGDRYSLLCWLSRDGEVRV
jgi:predicted 2-oxoglutarate/Fe(II)-dependent dioxygenase YbiX